MAAVSELEQAIGRANLRQAALIALPWTLLQLGLFWALSSPSAGENGIALVGIAVLAVTLALALFYRQAEAESANLLIRQMDSDLEYYGVFTWLRQWSEQLELTRKRCPGYLNTLRLNYVALPLALLAFLLQFWTAALLLLPVWLVTGMLVRAAMARAVLEREVPAFRPTGWKILLLLLLMYLSWGGMRYLADRAGQEYEAELAKLKQAGEPVSAADLREGYRLNGRNGAELVAALGEIPEVPAPLRELAAPVWIGNVPPDGYVGMEKYVFDHGELMRKLAELGAIPTGRLGYDFDRGLDGVADTQEAVVRYHRLFNLEALRFLTAAGVGNDRQVVESWIAMGNLRRQLSKEPALIYMLVAMAMESRRIDLLERLVNEFGIHSEEVRKALLADLSATEGELSAHFRLALRGEAALSLISGFDSGGEGLRDAGAGEWFPAMQWAKYSTRALYLRGISLCCRIAAGAASGPEKPDAMLAELSSGAFARSGDVALFGGPTERYIHLLRKVRAARIGLVLDGYRRAHGGFPEALAGLKGLSPDDLRDPGTGAPMRYATGFRVEVVDVPGGKSSRNAFEGVEIGAGKDGFRLRR